MPVPERNGTRMTSQASGAARWSARTAGWLRGSRLGLFVIAVVVGVGSGLGAVVFRYLIYFFTWLWPVASQVKK